MVLKGPVVHILLFRNGKSGKGGAEGPGRVASVVPGVGKGLKGWDQVSKGFVKQKSLHLTRELGVTKGLAEDV